MKQIEQELRQVAQAHGGILKPADVVEFARNEGTKLHSRFTWDDGAAAERWRLQEARNVIQAVVTVAPETGRRVRAFVSLEPDRPEGGYRSIVDVMSDDERREMLLSQALKDFKILQAKYRDLSELAEVFASVQKVANG